GDQVPPKGRRARLPVQEEAHRALPRRRRQGEGDDLLSRPRDGASRDRAAHSGAADSGARRRRAGRNDAADGRQPDAHHPDAASAERWRQGETGGRESRDGELKQPRSAPSSQRKNILSASSAVSAVKREREM